MTYTDKIISKIFKDLNIVSKEIIQDGSIYYDVPCKNGCGITILHEDEIDMDYLCYDCSGSWGIIKIEENK